MFFFFLTLHLRVLCESDQRIKEQWRNSQIKKHFVSEKRRYIFLRLRYLCKSGIVISAWRVTWNNANSSFNYRKSNLGSGSGGEQWMCVWVCCYVQVYFVMYRYILLCTGRFYCVLVDFVVHRYILLCTGNFVTYRQILLCIGRFCCVQVDFIVCK